MICPVMGPPLYPVLLDPNASKPSSGPNLPTSPRGRGERADDEGRDAGERAGKGYSKLSESLLHDSLIGTLSTLLLPTWGPISECGARRLRMTAGSRHHRAFERCVPELPLLFIGL